MMKPTSSEESIATRRRRASVSLTVPQQPMSPRQPSPRFGILTNHHNNNNNDSNNHNNQTGRSRHCHSRSQQLPSTSSPFGNLLFGHQHSHSISSSGSNSPSEAAFPPFNSLLNQNHPPPGALSVEFDGQPVLRPNRIVHGRVILHAAEPMYVTRIRIKFRAEEIATIKVEEGGSGVCESGTGSERIHQSITTFFETEYKLWGSDSTAYELQPWEELEQGRHEFPFALKFPNVNYPPSIDDPPGFSVRYIWTAHTDGPALQSGLRSRKYMLPYRPIIVSPPAKQWSFQTTLHSKDKRPYVHVQTRLNQQAFCPDEPLAMQLQFTMLCDSARVAHVQFRFRKHHQGKMLIQRGTALRSFVRDMLQGNVAAPFTSLEFDIPTRMVSPTFSSRNTRVYYDLFFVVTVEEQQHLFKKKSNLQCEFVIPINIGSLPHQDRDRVPALHTIQHYTQSRAMPEFFDPTRSDSPDTPVPYSSTMDTGDVPPPGYYDTQHTFAKPTQRQERNVYLTRSVNGLLTGGVPGCSSNTVGSPSGIAELGEVTTIPGLFDEDW